MTAMETEGSEDRKSDSGAITGLGSALDMGAGESEVPA